MDDPIDTIPKTLIRHAVDLEQCSIVCDSGPLSNAMIDAAKVLRALAERIRLETAAVPFADKPLELLKTTGHRFEVSIRGYAVPDRADLEWSLMVAPVRIDSALPAPPTRLLDSVAGMIGRLIPQKPEEA